MQRKYVGYLVIIVLLILVIIGVALTDYDPDPETPTASEAADSFAEDYTDGTYGTFTVDDGATDDAATVTSSIALAMGPHNRTFTIDFTVDDDAETTYSTQVGYLEKLTSTIGTPEKIDVKGYDNITAYKMDVNHYGMTFTFLYFIAYNDNLIVSAFSTTESDGTTSGDVWSGVLCYDESNPVLATDDQNLAVLQAAVSAIGIEDDLSL